MDLSNGLNVASKSGGGGGGLSNPFPVIVYSVTLLLITNAILVTLGQMQFLRSQLSRFFTAILPVLKSHLTRIFSYPPNPENVRPHSMENSTAL